MAKNLKKALALCLSLVLIAAVAMSGTIAYLFDTDEAVNVMTLGNVYIEQIEQERVDDSANQTELKQFVQGKGVYPAVYEGSSIPWAPEDEWVVPGDQAWKVVADNENVIDKFVTVENTGKSAAYVRTIFAIEVGPDGVNDPYMHIVTNGTNIKEGATWTWEWLNDVVTIDGTGYAIAVATYTAELAAGDTTIPSLKQVYLDKTATNEVVALYGDSYEILALSQAVQTEGFADAATALDTAFGKTADKAAEWFGGDAFELPVVVDTAEELKAVLTEAAAANSGDTTILLGADVDLSDMDWTPINVDGYHGAGVVTLEGGNHTITGLSAPLFEGGFAGKSGIIIKNLTIADSEIKSDSDLGAGAFIATADSMHVITLENCHLVDSTVYAPDARSGGLLGWASGYSKQDDGPVKAYITIKDCSVTGSTVTGTAVGGIAGHPGASDWTYTTIENCTVLNNTLTSTDDGNWRVGAIVGTANNGHIVINNCTIGNNAMSQPNGGATDATTYDGDEVGRFVPSGTGTLEVNGTSAVTLVSTKEDLVDALQSGENVVLSTDIESTSPVTLNGGTLNGGGNTLDSDYVGTSGWGQYAIVVNSGTVENINVVDAFRGIGSTNTTDDVYVKNVTIDNVTYAINGNGTGTQNVYVSDSTIYGWISYADVASINFTNCTLGKGNSYDGYMVIYGTTNYTDCTFENGFAMCGDLRGNLGATVTFTNCTYNGVKVTADNFKTLFMAEGDATDFNKLANYKIVIDGATVAW